MSYRGKHALSAKRAVRRYALLFLGIVAFEAAALWTLNRAALQDAEFKSVPVALPRVTYVWDLPPKVASAQIAVSYDGRFAAYPDGRQLIIADLAQRRVVKAIARSGVRVSLVKWLPDRDRLFYATYRRDGTGSLELRFFDAETGEERPINEIIRRSPNSKVVGASVSSFTNLAFFQVEDGPHLARLYRLDVMGDLYRVRRRLDPLSIALLPHQDVLLVDDGRSRQVIGLSGVLGTDSTPVDPQGAAGAALIGVDDHDRVLLGEVSTDGDRVLSVDRGKVGGEFKPVWRSREGVARAQLTVTADGSLYVHDQKGLLTQLAGGRRFSYRGELVSFDGRLLVTRDGRRLSVESVR